MDEKLIKILQRKDNYSENQCQRINHLAKYMRKRGFNKNYKDNVVRLITHYNYIKSIDTKGYRNIYIDAFSSYINKHYDSEKTKEYFEDKISEDVFLKEFIRYYNENLQVQELKKDKTKSFHLIKKSITPKVKQVNKFDLSKIKTKQNFLSMKVNMQYFLEKVYLIFPIKKRRREIDNWWNEYYANLEEARKNDYDLFCNQEQKEKTIVKTQKNSISKK